MSASTMAKKDFITSIVLIAFSISVIVASYTMPRLERRGIDPFSAPGVVPGLIGLVLLCLSLILFIRSIRRRGYLLRGTEDAAARPGQQGAVARVCLTLAVSAAYAVGLLGHLDYSLATGIYIFCFICLFEFRPSVSPLNQKRMFALALVQAVTASLAVTLVFEKLFLVDLP